MDSLYAVGRKGSPHFFCMELRAWSSAFRRNVLSPEYNRRMEFRLQAVLLHYLEESTVF